MSSPLTRVLFSFFLNPDHFKLGFIQTGILKWGFVKGGNDFWTDVTNHMTLKSRGNSINKLEYCKKLKAIVKIRLKTD